MRCDDISRRRQHCWRQVWPARGSAIGSSNNHDLAATTAGTTSTATTSGRSENACRYGFCQCKGLDRRGGGAGPAGGAGSCRRPTEGGLHPLACSATCVQGFNVCTRFRCAQCHPSTDFTLQRCSNPAPFPFSVPWVFGKMLPPRNGSEKTPGPPSRGQSPARHHFLYLRPMPSQLRCG